MATIDMVRERFSGPLLEEVALLGATDDERLQAVAALRVTVWTTALLVAYELGGPEELRKSVEGYVEADTLLAALIFGWVPGTWKTVYFHPISSISGKTEKLMRCLLRQLAPESNPVVACMAVDALYRATICKILAGSRDPKVTRYLDLHHAIRQEVLREAQSLLGCGKC